MYVKTCCISLGKSSKNVSTDRKCSETHKYTYIQGQWGKYGGLERLNPSKSLQATNRNPPPIMLSF